ncbi:MAG: four helix bundle protein [Bacteroidaceae bacterium]|nr:four helix bundle protein [Bacteroidaceae bacterium]
MEDFYYRNLMVYGQAKQLVADVYALSRSFPTQEQYGLTNQIQRAAISVPSNIAEGMGRFSLRERIHFVEIAYGSMMETMCQLEIAEMLGYISSEVLAEQDDKIRQLARMLLGLKHSIEEKQNINQVRQQEYK